MKFNFTNVGFKSNFLGIGSIYETQGIVIINPFGELGELNYKKVYDVLELDSSERTMLMYPNYKTIVLNLNIIRQYEPIIYLTPSQEKEINFLKCFFNTKTIIFSKEKFLEWLSLSNIKDLERHAKSNNQIKCVYIYLTLYEKYNLLLNPNMFRKIPNTTFLFKDLETLETISKINDFYILKNIVNNFFEYDLSLDYIHELLFSICSDDKSKRKEALFEIVKFKNKSVVELEFDNEIINQFIQEGYIVKEGDKYKINL